MDACSLKCVLMGSICVSVCRCCVFVSCVHPVMILLAVLSIVCSLFRFVVDIMGDVIVLAYSSLGLIIVLYVVVKVSLFFPQCVPVSALSILMLSLPFVVMFSVCLLY